MNLENVLVKGLQFAYVVITKPSGVMLVPWIIALLFKLCKLMALID